MKTCSKCKIDLQDSEFGTDKRNSSGLQSQCRMCQHICYLLNRITVMTRAIRWRKDNPQRSKNIQKKSRKKSDHEHPEKIKARNAVNNALRDGRLVKMSCGVFDCFLEAEAHHEDYSKPLDVQWLCTKHHKQLHRKANNE